VGAPGLYAHRMERGCRELALAVAVSVLVIAPACGLPRDPEGTLERARGGVMRVGIAARDPWTRLEQGRPAGIEVELVKAFARHIDAEIEWVAGSEADVVEALVVHEVDLVVAGLTSTDPWSSEVTFTHPYYTSDVRVGSPDAGVEDIAGLEVAVERGTEAAGVLEKTDAIPVRVDDIAEADGAAAVENWLLDDLGLVDTGVRLSESDHVMAVAAGENAFIVALERFLLEREHRIAELVNELGAL
jgi:polar amino acid transport system substrate-binding protein